MLPLLLLWTLCVREPICGNPIERCTPFFETGMCNEDDDLTVDVPSGWAMYFHTEQS